MFPSYPYPRISVIICTLNEEKNLYSVLPQIPVWVDEVIIADGHSTDNTVIVAKELRPSIKIVYQPKKGKGDALKCAVKLSTGDIIVTLDADGTYPPQEMHNFVKAILAGYDFAKGTRFYNGYAPDCMPKNRQIGNKILALTSNVLFQTDYTDICSGYYAFKKEIFKKIRLMSDGFEMEQELFIKIEYLNYNVVEVPHSYYRRAYGKSKTRNLRQGLTNIFWIFSLRFRLINKIASKSF